MIAGVRGTVAALEDNAVVVDLHGFLVRVLSSANTLNGLPGAGEPIELATYLQVREDALTLYGFATDAELQLFQLLLGVNGVGPRAALSLLSFAEPTKLYEAIANEDADLLSKVPGIGKVTAGRIVLDLKRKLPDDFAVSSVEPNDRDREAIAALEALGYSASEARRGLAAVANRSGMTVEERIYASLQNMDSA